MLHGFPLISCSIRFFVVVDDVVERSHLQLRTDHIEVKLIWILIQRFLSESSKSVLFLVVVTGK